MTRKLSIGVNWAGDFNIDDIVEQAKVADESGVYALNVAEAWGPDALTLLTVLARETKHIQLGTSIINTYSRTPGAMAQHFATMDHISNGRMFIGLGSSGPNVIEHFHGVKFGQPLTRIKEYTEIINMIMRQEKLQYDGKIFNMSRGFTMRFTPLREKIPIHIASITPKSLEQTATIADGWIPIFLPKEQWESQLKQFYGYVEAAGRSRDEVVVRNATGVTITDDPERARTGAAGNAAFYIARMGDFYYDHFSRMGYADEANAVRKAWAEGGSAAGAAALPKELAEQLGTAGSVDECIDAMEQAEAAGFDWHSVNVSEPDPKKRAEIYERLAG